MRPMGDGIKWPNILIVSVRSGTGGALAKNPAPHGPRRAPGRGGAGC